MAIPVIRGTIDRRILVNYRADPAVLARLLPEPFRPLVVNGAGIAGICLIRLTRSRPRWLPGWLGVNSENAAHRIAVEWEDHHGHRRTGVYIPRRDTSSRLNALAGGRLFPGRHHLARFDVTEGHGRYRVVMAAKDGLTHLSVEGRETDQLPKSSVFGSLRRASEFFERGSIGYSPTRCEGRFDGLELRTFGWEVRPLAVESVESNYFDDPEVFPPGSVEFDCALLMRGVEHEWHAAPGLSKSVTEGAVQVPRWLRRAVHDLAAKAAGQLGKSLGAETFASVAPSASDSRSLMSVSSPEIIGPQAGTGRQAARPPGRQAARPPIRRTPKA